MLPHVATKLHGLLLCSSGFLLWAGHGHFIASAIIFSRKWLAWIVSQTPEWHPPSPVWCCSCMTLGKSIPLSVWATTSDGCILNPNLGQSLLLFSALNSFLHCLFLLPETIHIVWLGFAQQKHCLCIYHNIEIQISFQFCYTQIIANSTRNPSLNSQSFVKEAAIWFVVVYITVELLSLLWTFLS